MLEAMAPVDILRRAGVEIKTISLTNSLEVTSSNGITIKADATMADEDCNETCRDYVALDMRI